MIYYESIHLVTQGVGRGREGEGGGGRGREGRGGGITTWSLKKSAHEGRGGKALMTGPLKKYFVCGFPKSNRVCKLH